MKLDHADKNGMAQLIKMQVKQEILCFTGYLFFMKIH